MENNVENSDSYKLKFDFYRLNYLISSEKWCWLLNSSDVNTAFDIFNNKIHEFINKPITLMLKNQMNIYYRIG